MDIGIQYDTSNGHIEGTTRPPVPSEQELPSGVAQIVVPDGTDTELKKVNLTTLELVDDYAPLAARELFRTDQTVRRCYEAGIPFPNDWKVYSDTLRAIVSGTIDGPLPDKPDYP